MTGGTSFIGGHVVPKLVADGHQVTILARDPGKIPGYAGLAGVSIVAGSLADDDVIFEALAGHDALVHLALGHGGTARERVVSDTVTTVNLFQSAAEQGLRHIVHTSTVGVYEHRPGRYGDSDPARPTHVYGATKAAGESYAFAIADSYGIRANVIRPGYTFGAPETDGAPIQSMPELPEIVRAVAAGTPVELVRNAGLQFIWAGDLARVYAAVLSSSEPNRRTFTALSPAFITWETVARWAIDELGSPSELSVADEGIREAALTFDVSEIEREFGFAFDAEPKLREHLRYLATAL
ncbi:NAD-dependent epimerase/dehydratase family protein [Gryllotalpicola protaetiae]|uniref:NAD-dependent epimerase/dehydratase family protein n=1 Tax=Gryllotalpicola protaetiae TaxID=2419771 RepID=UPI0013C46B61|nr:NAD(P)-dependent oxidoreductase [Gryllotalpicola protaetiae]